jgi:hypothetical protein
MVFIQRCMEIYRLVELVLRRQLPVFGLRTVLIHFCIHATARAED